jgi:peptidoglycan hydrolase-like protein with peptidoglycan-binding domain
VLGERIELIEELITEVRFGQRGPRVRTLQVELTRLGYMPRGWRTTDFYGTVTRAAVQRYIAQRDAEPAVSGGDAEIDALIARTSFGQRSADVTRLQELLKAKGFFPAAVRSTGFYFTITRDSVRRYQASTN